MVRVSRGGEIDMTYLTDGWVLVGAVQVLPLEMAAILSDSTKFGWAVTTMDRRNPGRVLNGWNGVRQWVVWNELRVLRIRV